MMAMMMAVADHGDFDHHDDDGGHGGDVDNGGDDGDGFCKLAVVVVSRTARNEDGNSCSAN